VFYDNLILFTISHFLLKTKTLTFKKQIYVELRIVWCDLILEICNAINQLPFEKKD
jgi:hypothetical protein